MMTPSPSDLRTCRTCSLSKPLYGFYAHGNGHMTECKECWRARVKLRRLTNPAVRAYDRERAKTPERVRAASAITRNWRERNPEAYRAQNSVNNALRDGKLERKPCEICAATQHVHAHHRDYAKPLEVVWLCARCHHRLHAIFPELEGANKHQEAR